MKGTNLQGKINDRKAYLGAMYKAEFSQENLKLFQNVNVNRDFFWFSRLYSYVRPGRVASNQLGFVDSWRNCSQLCSQVVSTLPSLN